MLRTRTEIMEIIIKDETLKTLFDSWETEFQEEFLNICTGISGVKVLYDFMIKEILNPEAVPERIGELLSLLLNQKVKVLPYCQMILPASLMKHLLLSPISL